MAFIFAITTPVGIAIGIGIASTYNANSSNALITQGIFDAVSTGEQSLKSSISMTCHAACVQHVPKGVQPLGRCTALES